MLDALVVVVMPMMVMMAMTVFLVQFSGNGLLRMTWDLSFDLLFSFPWVGFAIEVSISLSFPSGFDEHCAALRNGCIEALDMSLGIIFVS